MLSTQRLWPSSCSFCVAFMPAPSSWMPEKCVYPALHAGVAGGVGAGVLFDPIPQGSIRVTEPSPSLTTQTAVVPTAIAAGSGPTAIRPPSGGPEGAAGVFADRDGGPADGLQRGVDAGDRAGAGVGDPDEAVGDGDAGRAAARGD